MSERNTTEAVPDTSQNNVNDEDLVAEDLIEEISIDGMCGVY